MSEASATFSDPRYPIGPFTYASEFGPGDREACISAIAALPAALRASCDDLNEEQLDTPYREGGWTVRQLVHHVFDSHANAFIRFRLALTEDHPRITAYNEADWAKLPDTFDVPIGVSLDLLDGLHRRWVSMLNAMLNQLGDSVWSRTLDHPENGTMSLDMLLQMYAWHGAHHTAHVTRLREAKGW